MENALDFLRGRGGHLERFILIVVNREKKAMQAVGYILTALLGVLVGGFVRLWRSYSEEKGKNLATKEDIAELTKAAKEIEAAISSEVWDRQRQWEMKRDAVIEAVQALSAAEDALMRMYAHYKKFTDDEWIVEVKKAYEQSSIDCTNKMTEFESKRNIARLICSDTFNLMLTEVRFSMRKAMSGMLKRQIRSYDEIGPLVSPARRSAMQGARKELGLPDEISEHMIDDVPEIPEE
ncbi:MAG TPA: hypothetical protein VGI45_24885 [Terracidiphilus sp.]